MASLLQVNGKTVRELSSLTKEDYKTFLREEMVRLVDSGIYNSYKVIREKQLFRFFIYPPVVENMDYPETDEQREGRLELQELFRVKYNRIIIDEIKNSEEETQSFKEPWLRAFELESVLGVTRRTLYVLMDDEDSELQKEIHQRELYITKESILAFLNKRHIVGTNLGFDKLYKKVKPLFAKAESEMVAKRNEKTMAEIITSYEYEKLWDKYFKKVPEDRRIYRDLNKSNIDGYKIYTTDLGSENYFSIYNPNIMIAKEKITKIPKLYPISHIAALLDTTVRTVGRYCEFGYISYYKIGGKYMFTMEDFSKEKDKLEVGRYKGKESAGRKRKIETIFRDEDILDTEIYEKFKDNKNLSQFKNLYSEYQSYNAELKELEVKIQQIKKLDKKTRLSESDKEYFKELSDRLKVVKAEIGKISKILNKLRRNFFSETIIKSEDEFKDIIENISTQEVIKKNLRKMVPKSDKDTVSILKSNIASIDKNLENLKIELIQRVLKL